MEESVSSAKSQQRGEALAHSLREGRSRVGDALAAQRDRMDRLEEELVSHIQQLSEELADDRQNVDDRHGDLESQLEALEQKKLELVADQQEWTRAQGDVEAEQRELADYQHSQQTELEDLRRQLAERDKTFAERENQFEQQDRQSDEAERAQQRTTEEFDNQAKELAEAREKLQELDELRSHRDDLSKALEASQQKLTELDDSASGNEELQQKMADHQRRFELAIEDLREVKTRNADLEEQLAQANASQGASANDTNGGSLDWEAQKRRLLASLDDDFAEENEEDRRDRLTIEGAIRITDEVVAKKQEELDELKTLLNEQSSRVGEVAVGAAAIAEIIDQDELIQEERARLERIKNESKEKLSKAEVEISLERANLARREVELQEKLEAVEVEAAKLSREKGTTPTAKPDRGRWLTRLGLKDKDE